MDDFGTITQTEQLNSSQNNTRLSAQTIQQLNWVAIANQARLLAGIELSNADVALAQMTPAPVQHPQQLQQQIQQFALHSFESNWQQFVNL